VPVNYGRSGEIEEQREKGESRAADRVPPPPYDIFKLWKTFAEYL
jgi:hypothetical protein